MPFNIPNVADAFNSQQSEVDSGDFEILSRALQGVGVVSGCAVTAQGTPDMTVAVAVGIIRIGNVDVAVAAGNVTITAADATNPRIDLILVNASATKSALAGTPAAKPVYPTITADTVVLAAVYVPANDTDIEADHIIDKRAFVAPRSFTIWLPDAPPASAGALDDEFDGNEGAGTPTGWTEYDHDAQQAVSEQDYGLQLVSDAGTLHVTGVYKADPTGDLTIWAKCELLTARGSDESIGLAIFEDATSPTGDVAQIRVYVDATSLLYDVHGTRWSGYNGFTSGYFGIENIGGPPSYQRIRRNGTTYSFEVSHNGIDWLRLHSGALGFTPAQVGVVLQQSNTSTPIVGVVRFFRSVASDVGLNGVVSGRRVAMLGS